MKSRTRPGVGVSRVLGLPAALAVGLSLGVPLTSTVGDQLLAQRGLEAPATLLWAALLLLPLVLSSMEISGRSPGEGTLYALARVGSSGQRAFAVGWLVLGGYTAVSALLVGSLAEFGRVVILRLLGYDLHPILLVGGLVILFAAYQAVAIETLWRSRTVLVLGAIATIFGVVLVLLLREPQGLTLSAVERPAWHRLTPLASVAVVLWALEILEAYRPLLRRPEKTAPRATLLVWGGAMAFNVVLGLILIRRPEFESETLAQQLTLTEARVEMILFLAVFVLLAAAIWQVLAGWLRIWRSLTVDGFLPSTGAVAAGRPTLAALTLWCAAMLLVVHYLAEELTVAFAAAMVLAGLALVLGPYARRPRSGERGAAFRFPLHPLLPGIALAEALYLIAVLPTQSQMAAIVWLLLGLVVWLLFARHGAVSLERRERVVERASSALDPAGRKRILVAVESVAGCRNLIQLAVRLAQARDAQLLLLHIEPQPEQTPLRELRASATQRLAELEHALAELELPVEPQILIRLAPSRSAGILETANELEVDLILLSWSRRSLGEGEDVVGEVFEATHRPLMILRNGLPEGRVRSLVATAGGPHARLGLQLACALREGDVPEDVTVVSVSTPGGPGLEVCREALEHITAARPDDSSYDSRSFSAEDAQSFATEIVQAVDLEKALLDQAEERDLLIVGASSDMLHRQAMLQGLPADLAERYEGATVIVKETESRGGFLLRRIWNLLSSPLPQLSESQQAKVYNQMRSSARADVDFYTLIILSSLIAVAGLVLDSGAVIIGAMLIAPLMSPIMSLAHGVVQGNPLLMRRAASSTFRGASLAIGVSTVFGLALRLGLPTQEMLGRSEPNLIDLVVALAAGAAAAYAMSRSSVAAALPGVAISVALVPPLCVVGWGLGASQFELAAGALLLFLTNLVGIVLVGALVFILMGFRPARTGRTRRISSGFLISLAAMVALGIPLASTTARAVREYQLEAEIEERLRTAEHDRVEVLDYSVEYHRGELDVFLRVVTYENLDDDGLRELVREFRADLQSGTPVPVRLRVTAAEARRFLSVGGSDE